jgi:hypothetical protein
MRRVLLRILAALQLARISTAFAAVANVWFIILWTHHNPNEPGTTRFFEFPLLVLLAGGAANALGLFGFATAMNDVVDVHRDKSLHPERPIPSGRVSIDGAVMLVAWTLGLAVLGATVLGMESVLLTILIAGAILFFNTAGKYIPAIGLVVLGLIYAGQMVVPNLHLRFVIPVWLVMTHALVVAGATHVLGRKAPGLSVRATIFAVAGWLFWSGVMFFFGWYRNRGVGGVWPEWAGPRLISFAWIALAIFAYVALVFRRLGSLGRGPRVAEKIARYGALWLPIYGSIWLFIEGDYRGGPLLLGVAVFGLLGMTLLREGAAMLQHPLDYRR